MVADHLRQAEGIFLLGLAYFDAFAQGQGWKYEYLYLRTDSGVNNSIKFLKILLFQLLQINDQHPIKRNSGFKSRLEPETDDGEFAD